MFSKRFITSSMVVFPLLLVMGCNKSDTKNAAENVAKTAPAAMTPAGVFQSKGCFACHSTDGSAKVGPTLKGVLGSTVELQDGKKVVADKDYIRESILFPQKKIVKGYPPSMPNFNGMLNEDEINALITYIESLK